MAKKKDNTVAWVIGILLVLVLIIGGSQGWFKGTLAFGNLNMLDLYEMEPDDECRFMVDKERVCLGDNVTGTIRAFSPSCYVGFNYNNEGWRFAGVINETSVGFYEESRRAPAIGNYIFTAICGTPSKFCRTNDVEVDVINCDDDAPNGVEYTCGWVGEQCGGTCPSSHPLCVDMWYDVLFGGYSFCACINPNDETVHPDWKPDGQYHDDSGAPNGDDFPNGEPEDVEDYNCGQGSDAQCGGTCPSDYPYCEEDFIDLYLYNCKCENINGQPHPDWQPGGSMFNEQGEYPEEPLNCIDSDGVDVFTIGVTTYMGTPFPDICHAGYSYAVDEYVCIDDVAVKKEISCPNTDCSGGRCSVGTTTVYNECLNLGYANGGGCYSAIHGVAHPELDIVCGDLYPLNYAQCFS